MKEQLITYPTAVLAKEKGFNIPCNTHCFIGNTNKIVYEKSVHCIDWGNRPSHITTVQKHSAPTQSLLQKWLRETYDFHITVDFKPIPNLYEDGGGYSSKDCFTFKLVELTDKEEILSIVKYGLMFDTYEEALEAGLQEALKLINNQENGRTKNII